MKDKVIKICVVCGDTAIARNFGAFTCKSCKPFFRRNANKIFKCKSEGNCLINQITRKKCRKCRLDKCFAVGMKKEMILNEVDKHIRRSLVEDNRKIKQKCVKLRHEDIETNSIDKDRININWNSSFCSEISLSNQSHLFYDSNEKSEFECLAITRPVNNYHKNFTELEEYKLSELFRVFSPVVNLWNKNYILFDIKDVSEIFQTCNYFYEREINNFIKAIKKMNVFEDICQNDRIALVKYSCMDILCLRAMLCYDLNKDSWIVSVDQDHALSLSLDLLKGLKRDIYFTYKNYLNGIIKECNSNIVILDLLTAIALFNPNRPNLINRDIVRVQQQIYLHLLQRYLTFKYRTKFDSEVKSAKLFNTLINAHILGELEKKYLIEDYQDQYGPLIKEVLDLKTINSDEDFVLSF